MGKGGYNGGGTVVSPIQNPDWFSGGDEPEDDDEAGEGTKKPIAMSSETEQEIASLRRSIAALSGQLKSTENQLTSEKTKLIRILTKHGQPLDEGLQRNG